MQSNALRGTLGLMFALTVSLGGCAGGSGPRVTDPDGDGRVELKGRLVEMDLPAEAHDYAPELQRWNAPRVTQKASGDFVADVKVTGEFDPKAPSTIEGRKPYNGAGLIVIGDPENTVTLQRGVWVEGKRRHDYVNFEVRENGKVTTSRSSMNVDEREAWLRLERRGGKFYAYASEDNGRTWRSYPPASVRLPDTVEVGVEAVSSSSRRFHCTLEDFSLFLKSPK